MVPCVAAVAQSVEQRIRNAKVGSSIPPSGTKKYTQKAVSLGNKPRLFAFYVLCLPV